MSAPTAQHESRLDTLAALADLAGYTVDVRLDGRLQPDVTRLHRSSARLFVADAKATESPKDPATRARLAGYAQRCDSWHRAGFGVSLAICHATSAGGGWLNCLRDIVVLAGFTEWTEMVELIEGSSSVSVVSLPSFAPVGPARGVREAPVSIPRLGANCPG